MSAPDDKTQLSSWWQASPPSRLGATVRDRVESLLRDRILVGDLRPGSRIDLDALAEELGTSRTPVREACLSLSYEGLVKVTPRSGITVIGVTADDTVENFTVMAVLSGVAAAWAAQRITPEDLEVVKSAGQAVVAAVDEGGDVATANWEFHRLINRACGSDRLRRLLRQTARTIPRRFFEVFPEQIPCSLAEHDDLVDALKSRDSHRARQIMESHFAASGELLSSRIHSTDWEPATKILDFPL